MSSEIKDKLNALYLSFAGNIPYKIASIEDLWSSLQVDWSMEKFADFHRKVHSLCGSAGTYGYIKLGNSARHLEIYLKSLLTTSTSSLSLEEINEINELLISLKEISKQASFESSDSTILQAKKSKTPVVYVIDKDNEVNYKDEILAGEFIFDFKYISSLSEFSELTEIADNKKPEALLVDVQTIKDSDVVKMYDLQERLSIPLFCVSSSDDILSRLKAVRMGSRIFFKKPVELPFLYKTLYQEIGLSVAEAYRILIIDDSNSLAQYFSLILEEAGMITRFITNAFLLLETIDDFQPDLLLMDIYMPECTGLELAKVLRQEQRYTTIPIIFVSTEDDKLKQLSALNVGGDDFLTKPILPKHLIEAVKSRAKRSGVLSSFMMKDSLTGLLNHTNILQRLETELARAKRQQESLAFIMLDIDNFKKVNDQYGHPVGDSVIQSLSSLLSISLRKTDVVGRYGGEEFSIMLPNTKKEDALKIANYLREKFANMEHHADENIFHVTFSAGIAFFPAITDSKSILVCADKALYQAKHEGRNKVKCYEKEEVPIRV